jgi:hypothetical protein
MVVMDVFSRRIIGFSVAGETVCRPVSRVMPGLRDAIGVAALFCWSRPQRAGHETKGRADELPSAPLGAKSPMRYPISPRSVPYL